MAIKDYSKDIANARNKKKEENTKNTASSKVKDYSSDIDRYRISNSVGFDTLQSDLTSLNKTISNVYNGWQTKETMQNTLSSVQSMYDRLGMYQEYQKKYGGTDLSELRNSYKSVLDGWKDLSKQYGKYKSAKEYNKAIKDAKASAEETEKMKTADLGAVRTEIADLEEILEKVKWYEYNINRLEVKKNTWEHRSGGLNTDGSYTSKVKEAENELSEYLKSIGYKSVDDLKNVLGEKKTYLNRAEWIQKGIEMSSVGDKSSENYDKDFAKKSEYVQEEKPLISFGPIDRYEEIYDYINADEKKKQQMVANIQGSADAHFITNGYDYMTDQEVSTYNYYYNQDKDKAAEYLNTIKEDLGSRKALADFERYEGKTGKELLFGVGAGLDQFVSGARNLLNTSDEYIPVNATQQLSGMIREDLSDDGFNVLGNSLGQTTYDLITTTTNMLPSILTAAFVSHVATPAVGANVGAGLMGASAAGNAYQEMLNLGYDKGQARTYSTLVGVAEAGLQRLMGGIGKLGGVSGKISKAVSGIDNGLARFAIRAPLSALSEGFEEAAQEVLSPLFQNLAAGYDTGADVDWSEVVYSGLLGALSGGFLEGGSLAVNSIAEHSYNKAMGQNIKANERVGDMFDLANNPEIASAYEAYNRYAKKGITAENISDAQLGRLYSNAKAEAVDTLNSKKSTSEQKTNALKTLAELSVVETENTIKKAAKEFNVGEETKVTESGDAIDIKGLKVKGDAVTVATDKGDVSVDDMTLTQRDAEFVVLAKGISKTNGEDIANLFINQYDGNTDVNEYANSFNLAIKYVENNFPQETILENKGVLSTSQVNAIYQATVINESNARETELKNLAEKQGKTMTIQGVFDDSIIDYNSSTNDGSKVNWNSLTTTQRSAIKFTKLFSKATGVNIKFVKSNVKDGKHEGKNGSYDPNTNTIEIDVYAGRIDVTSVKDSIIPTLSHEITHWMKAKSPSIYNSIKEDVIKTLKQGTGLSSDKIIAKEINRLNKNHPNKKHTVDEAVDEIVARACEDMLSNSNAARKLLNKMSASEQQSFIEKVKETFENLIQWVNDLLAHYKSTSEEAKILREYKHMLKKISKQWDEMLVKSVEANQALEKSGAFEHKNNIEGDVRNSIRKTSDGIQYVVLDKNLFVDESGKELTPRQAYNSLVGQKIVLEDGDVITFIKKLPGQRDVYNELFKKYPAFKDDINIKAVSESINKNIVETIAASKISKRNEKQKHKHLGVKDFDSRKVYVTDGNGAYELKLTIANLTDGKKIAYAKSFIEKASADILAKIKKAETVRKSRLNQLSNNSIRNSERNVNTNFSDRDSSGRELSEGQQEYFKDSVVRDENGNLLVMYHGTPNAGFTKFRPGTYFTEHKGYANRYQSQGASSLSYKKTADNPDTYAVYLNITKPFDTRNQKERDIFYNEYYRQWGTGTDLMESGLPDWMDGADLQEFLEENGYDYDGLILDEGGVGGYGEEVVSRGLSYVTFKPEQVKNIDNLNPTADEDIRFSMRENVEETKDLIAVHNMRVSELERTLDLGGLPMPSIAIIKAKSGHSEYGDVSLVFPKSTIDPKASRLNKVYGGDAWTPTYPTIEYKPNAKVQKKINDKYYALSKKFGNDESRPLYNYVYDMEDTLNRHKGEAEMIAELYEDERMMQLYLLDSGKDKIETIQKEVRTELTDAEVKMNEYFIKELGADVVDEVMWDGNGTLMSYHKNYLSKYEDAIREAYKKLLSEEYHFTDEQVQNVMDSTKNADLIRFVHDAHKYRENGRVTTRTEADYKATTKAIKDAAGEGYRNWIDSLFKGIEEKSGIRNNTDYFTNSGNRRSWEALHWENNLENVVRVMKSQENGQALFSGMGIWGVSAKEYSSISDIKADSSRLAKMSQEEYDSIKENFEDRFNEIAISMMDKTENNQFMAIDNAMECIVDALRNSKTKSGILNYLKQFRQLTVTETNVDDIVSLVTDISNMPTEYFEAKPKRAVELNEIATAIIPDNTSEATKTRLEDMGIKYLEYEGGNEQSRLKALNSLEDVRFSDRDTEGKTLTKAQQEFFKNSKVRDAEGNLRVMWHGTSADFTVFDISKAGRNWGGDSRLGKGFYFASTKEEAQEWGKSSKTIKAYLNLENPLDYTKPIPKNIAEEIDKYIEKSFAKYDEKTFFITKEQYGENLNHSKDIYMRNPSLFVDLFKYDDNGKMTDGIREFLSGLGYDGIISKDEVVAFYPEQIKLTTNKTPTKDTDIRYSERVTDEETLNFLNNQKTLKVYRAMQVIDGKLYPPMAAKVRNADGKKELVYSSEIGVWEQATEHPELIKDGKFNLDKANGSSINAAYNPYIHTSASPLNDQFSSAYKRENLVTVEGEIPISELTSGYRAEFAKDSVGETKWHSGPVASKLKGEKARKVYLSRWFKPTRIVPDAEVASIVAKTLEGENISVPYKVVTPSLREELEKEGVSIIYSEREDTSVYDLMGEKERILKENEKFKAEIERLNERLKLERKVTHGNYFNENQLGTVAGHLRKIANSSIDKVKLMKSLKDVYSFIAHSENLTWEEVFSKCYDIADAMLAEAKPITVVDDYSKYLLREIRNTRISLDDAQKAEAQYHFGKNWNRNFIGKIIISNDGINIDAKWQEWSNMHPEVFDADTNSSDMISELYDIIDTLKSASETIDEYGTEEQKRWLANEIYNQYWNVSPIRTTADKYDKQIKLLNFEHRRAMKEYRDAYEKRIAEQGLLDDMYYGRKLAEQKEKHSKELAEQKQRQKEMHKKLYAEIRERKDNEIALAKQHGREMLSKHKENAERKTRIQSITANSLSLNEMLVKNSKDKHVPEIMREPVTALLQAIDFSSKRMLEKGEPTRKDISLSKALGKVKDMMVKATNAHDELVELYGHGLDKKIEQMVDSVDDIVRTVGDNEYVLNKMTLTDLQSLDTMVKTIRHVVNKLNKFHTVHHALGIANLAWELILYLDSLGKGKVYDGLRGKSAKLLNWGNALPYYVFKRYGSSGMKIYEALQDGWDKFAFNTKKIIDYANDAYTSKEVKEWSEEVKTFKILIPANEFELTSDDYVPQYQEVQLTVPQIMSMYCLNKREQARGHLFKGGIRVADFKDKKGRIVSQSEGVIFTEKDVQTIFNALTERQKSVADKLQEFMNTVCADWGNDVSMARFGYKAFGEENYFPIQSDKNNLAVNDETEQPNSLFKLLNMSFTKSTIENANNRIVISDIFDVFAQHTSDMAKYNALALPVLDSFKWYNYTEKQDIAEGTFKTIGVKQSIERAFGKDGQNYFTTFLKDINGQQEVSRDTLGNGFFKNAKIAAVGANLRVVLLQPTSYVRASAVIDNKYLSKALIHKPKVKRAETYCGIALWKSMGYYDTNIQKGVEAQIKHADTWKDKATEWSMKGAEIADKVTWGYLWNACELEIRDTRKDLKVGSQEFYDAIAKRLREVIYATQVVDSTMTRSQMMRSSDGRDKFLTAFASEPTLAYNMLQDAYMEYHLDARRNGKAEAIKKNAKRMARIVFAYTMTNAVAALVESAFDALRDDEDEEMDVATFMKFYFSNFASDMSITAKIPYIKEFHSAIQGFTSSRTDTQWMGEMTKAITGWYKFIAEGKGKPKTLIKYSIKAISDLSGLPFYNVYRDTMATLNKLDLFTTEDLNEMFEDFFD